MHYQTSLAIDYQSRRPLCFITYWHALSTHTQPSLFCVWKIRTKRDTKEGSLTHRYIYKDWLSIQIHTDKFNRNQRTRIGFVAAPSPGGFGDRSCFWLRLTQLWWIGSANRRTAVIYCFTEQTYNGKKIRYVKYKLMAKRVKIKIFAIGCNMRRNPPKNESKQNIGYEETHRT